MSTTAENPYSNHLVFTLVIGFVKYLLLLLDLWPRQATVESTTILQPCVSVAVILPLQYNHNQNKPSADIEQLICRLLFEMI